MSKTPKPMKKANVYVAAACSIMCLLSACSVGKNAIHSQKPDIVNSDEGTASNYVQLNDGSIKQYKSLKLVTGVLTTPHLLADNNVVINPKDIMAYQDNGLYAVASKVLTSKKDSHVAVETLPGFAVQVLSGKVNVYTRKYFNGANAVDEYFLQNGNDGYIIAYSKEALKAMLKDDAKALEYFNSKSKMSPKSKKILVAVEMYNNDKLITKN